MLIIHILILGFNYKKSSSRRIVTNSRDLKDKKKETGEEGLKE